MLNALLAAADPATASAATESLPLLEQFVQNAWDPAFNEAYRWPLLCFVAVTLATGCTVIPLPEEIAVALAGFTLCLESAGEAQFLWPNLALAWLALCCCNVCGDSILFFVGRKLGRDTLTRWKWTRRFVTPQRLARVQGWFAAYGPGAVLLGRQIAGVRMCMFLAAGTSGMSWRRFALFDFTGALLSVPLWLMLGALAAHPDYGALWAREVAGRVSNGLALAALITGLAVFAAVKAASARTQKRPEPSQAV